MCARDLNRQAAARGRRPQRGATIIELMVGIVVAMLVGLAAASSAMFFSASQRQGMSSGGSVIGATTSLASLKEDISQAGLGFFGNARILCPSLNLSVGSTNFSQPAFAPLQVTRTADVDRLDVFYASQVSGGATVLLAATSDLTTAQLETYLPVSVGDAVLLAPAQPTAACTVRTVTANTPYANPAKQTLTFGNTGTHNKVAFAGPLTYEPQAQVSLLGELQWQRYLIDNGNLILERPLATTNPRVTLLRNVVAMRVQYGVADAGQTSISNWVEPAGTWATLDTDELQRVRAVRIGIVTRSPQPEKRDAQNRCAATAAAPEVLGFTTAPPSVGEMPWNCYRYRTSVVVVPLRNVAMGLKE